MIKLYGGIDLHSNNNTVGITDHDANRLYYRRLPNMIDVVLAELAPYQNDIDCIAVESTFNWYWLVDGLMAEGYTVHLANPSAMQPYKGLKHIDDKHDAFWLADMERLGILPKGYIYPKEDRAVRDLLRKRSHLVKLRTSLILSLQGIIHRNCGSSLSSNKIKQLKTDHVAPFLEKNEDLSLCGQISKRSIDYLSRQIKEIESVVVERTQLRESFTGLMTIPGVGKILALTIMLETGDPGRFRRVGNFASYCRKVSSKWTSNNKPKGKGNTKNGNKYLAWAFAEAAEYARRYDDSVKSYFNRKSAKTTKAVAYGALSHKLARAAYYIMRDKVTFDREKLFSH